MTINTEADYRAAWARTRELTMGKCECCPVRPEEGSLESEELKKLAAEIWAYEAIHYPT